MKRVCKNVDVTDAALIEEAVLECLRPAKKRQRADTARLFARVLGVSRRKAGAVLRERGTLYMTAVRKIGEELAESLRAKRLRLPKMTQEMRQDPSSKKFRKISILGIHQLMFDHIAVRGLRELSRRIGEYQVSSIPGRGAAYGKRAVERWLRDGGGKYAVKMDVRDFYGSIKRPVLMKWLHRHVKNRQLLWLVGQLVYSAPEGIPIGSFLSQTLANIYLSDLYHLAMEGCTSKRGRHQVAHAIFYMDDMLLLGSNKRQLRFAAQKLVTAAGELGLQIKPTWQVHRVSPGHPLDMMGYRFAQGVTTLRRRVFKAARRALLRGRRELRKTGEMCRKRARQLASYHGYMQGVACQSFAAGADAWRVFTIAFTSTDYGKSKIHTRAGAGHS